MQLQKQSSTFLCKNESPPSATSILSLSPMAYNITATLDKLTCTNHLDSVKYQDRFGPFFLSKIDSNSLDVKLRVSTKYDNKEFRLIQVFTMGEAEFNQFMRLRNQRVLAAENFARKENLSAVVIPTLFQDMDE